MLVTPTANRPKQGWPGGVLKLGANGAYVADRAGLDCQVSPVPVRALDTTAVGIHSTAPSPPASCLV